MTRFDPSISTLPTSQQAIWPALRCAQEFGFVLYGGTAVALQIGHRVSVDFDFFSDRPFAPETLRKAMPALNNAQMLDVGVDTLTVSLVPVGAEDPVKLSFFGGLGFGRVGVPRQSRDGVLWVASLLDLMATKLKVLHDRISAKDYIDLAAMIEHGVPLAQALAAARTLYGPAFEPAVALRAMTWFKGGDLDSLGAHPRQVLVQAAAGFQGQLPTIERLADRLLPVA